MHKLTRLKAQWQPTTVRSGSRITASPAQLLDKEIDKLHEYWMAQDTLEKVETTDRDCFPIATPQEIRRAALQFPVTTSKSLDGIHPRQVGLLSDTGLGVFKFVN